MKKKVGETNNISNFFVIFSMSRSLHKEEMRKNLKFQITDRQTF